MSLRILVAEDDVVLAIFTERVLTAAGHKVVAVAKKAERAVAAFEELRSRGEGPDLIIMDINLGAGDDGIAAAIRIRTLDTDVPVVFFTAYSDPGILARAS